MRSADRTQSLIKEVRVSIWKYLMNRPPEKVEEETKSMWSYVLFPIISGCMYQYFVSNRFSTFGAIYWGLIVGYLPTYIQTMLWSRKDGNVWKGVQRLKLWKYFRGYFKGGLSFEEPLNHDQLYIFCNFPHGSMSLNHFYTMTDCCGMLSQHYRGERRDLCASVLFLIPILKDVRIFLLISKFLSSFWLICAPLFCIDFNLFRLCGCQFYYSKI